MKDSRVLTRIVFLAVMFFTVGIISSACSIKYSDGELSVRNTRQSVQRAGVKVTTDDPEIINRVSDPANDYTGGIAPRVAQNVNPNSCVFYYPDGSFYFQGDCGPNGEGAFKKVVVANSAAEKAEIIFTLIDPTTQKPIPGSHSPRFSVKGRSTASFDLLPGTWSYTMYQVGAGVNPQTKNGVVNIAPTVINPSCVGKTCGADIVQYP